MTRALVVILVLFASTAMAKPTTPKQARSATEAAFMKALDKLKLKPIKLASVPADPEESVSEAWFVGNVVYDQNGHHDPLFVVDANKAVFRVVKKMTTVGRVKGKVCNAGPVKPIRVKRTRFDVPKGHTFQGNVEVAFDGYVVDEQNTCR